MAGICIRIPISSPQFDLLQHLARSGFYGDNEPEVAKRLLDDALRREIESGMPRKCNETVFLSKRFKKGEVSDG